MLGLWGASLAVRGLASRIDALASRLMRLGAQSRSIGRAASIIGTVAGLVLLPAGCILGLLALNYDPGSDLLDALPSLWTCIALVGGVSSLALTFVGVQFDPARGRARCPKCWYSMQGFEDKTCPECGRPPGAPTQLLRTRRSPPVIVCGVLLLVVSIGLSRLSAVRAMGWKGVFPTTVLILGMKHLPDTLIRPPNSAQQASWRGTLAFRVDNTVMPQWQEEWMRRRATDLYRNAVSPEEALRAFHLGGVYGGTDSRTCQRIRVWIARDLASPDPALNARGLELGPCLGWVFDHAESRRNDVWLLSLLASEDAHTRTGALSLLPHFANASPLLSSSLADRLRDRALPEDQRTLAATALMLAPANDISERTRDYDLHTLLLRTDPATRRCTALGLKAAVESGAGAWTSHLRGLAFDAPLVIDLLTDPQRDASSAGAALVNWRVMNTGNWDETLIDAVVPLLERGGAGARAILAALVAAGHPGPLPPQVIAALEAAAAGNDADLAANARELLYITHTIPRPKGAQPAEPSGPP